MPVTLSEIELAGLSSKSGYKHGRHSGHSANYTNDYVFSQLIPYIGNKRKLLPLIARGIASTGRTDGTFVDLFTGSTVVARFAKSLGFRVIANDWEPYSFEIAHGTVALNAVPEFRALGGADNVFEYLNTLEPLHDYIARHLCPKDDEHPDPMMERMFYTRENGERMDAMREQIALWEAQGALSLDERAYILAAFMYAASYVSNTSGVFKGFHNGWGGQTGTALYRIRSRVMLKQPILYDNGQENSALKENAQRLAGHLKQVTGVRPDFVYIDPPYNQHPYGSNYHVLNTVALWDKPPLNPTIRVAGRKHDKSAIRKDWRTARRSPYNFAREALPAFESLVSALDVPWILVSYSTDGNIPLEGMLTAMAKRGSLRVFTQKYKRYRVSSPRMSPKPHNIEFLAVLNTTGEPCVSEVPHLADSILNEEAEALAQPETKAKQLSLF